MNWLKAFWQKEKKKTEHLDRRGKAAYIWEYYKLWIIGIGSFLIIGGWLAIRIFTELPDNWYFMAIVNTRQEVGTDSEFWEGYVDYTGYDLTQKKVEFNKNLYFEYADDGGRGNDYYNAFVAYVDSGRLDAAVMSTRSLTAFGASGRLLDLNREECQWVIEKYGDRLIYATPIDTEYSTEPIPIGIDIGDSILMTKYEAYQEDCALGISANVHSMEGVEKFLEYIFEENQ